jgi:hypothetical protein
MQGAAHDVAAAQTRCHDIPRGQAGPRRAAGNEEGGAGTAELRLVASQQARLILLRHLQRKMRVAVRKVAALGKGLDAGTGKQGVDAPDRDVPLLALVPARHADSTPGPDFTDSVARGPNL